METKIGKKKERPKWKLTQNVWTRMIFLPSKNFGHCLTSENCCSN